MGDTTDIRKGAIIRHNGNLFMVTEFQFVNPGKGSAFTKTKLRGISTDKGMEITYKSGEAVDTVQVQRQNMQYLYKNGEFFSFMNQSTYETADVSADLLGDDAKFLKEGIEVVAMVHNDGVVGVELPKKIQYRVVDSPPAVKGDSSGGNITKEAIMENGLKVNVPIFIKEGEEILVNTETGDYGGRALEK